MDTQKGIKFPVELFKVADEKTNRRKNFAHARGLDLETVTCQNIDAYETAKKAGFVNFLDVFNKKEEEQTKIVTDAKDSFPRKAGRPRK